MAVSTRSILRDDLSIRGKDVTRGMQCMILGAYSEGCSTASVSTWLHYWTGWNIVECDKIVDTVIAISYKRKTCDV